MRALVLVCAFSAVSVLALDNRVRNEARNLLHGLHPKEGQVTAARYPSNGAPKPTPTVHSEVEEPQDYSQQTQVIRVTERIILPRPTSTGHAGGEASSLTARPPAPHIRDTIRAIAPLANAIVRHPLRYSYYALKGGAYLTWRVTRIVLGFVLFILRPFLVPFYIAFVLPASYMVALVNELQPLLTFLLSGTILGLFIGVVAGFFNGAVSDAILRRSAFLGSTSAISPNTSPTRRRPTSGMSYLDSPSAAGAGGDDDDDDFRASLKFAPLPPRYGRRLPTSNYFSGSEEGEGSDTVTSSNSAEEDDGPATPRAASSPIALTSPAGQGGIRMADASELRRRTSYQMDGPTREGSISSTSSSGGSRTPLPSPLVSALANKDGTAKPAKAVSWAE